MPVQPQLLGVTRVWVDGEDTPLPTRRATALLAYLAVTRRRHTRAHLAELLWPQADPSTGRGNLRVVLSNLRRTLPDAIELDRDLVAITDAVCEATDVAQFDNNTARGLADVNVSPSEAEELLETAHLLYGGQLLEDVDVSFGTDFESWLTEIRQELAQRHQQVLYALLDRHLANGRVARSLSLAETLLAVDPYDSAAMMRFVRAMVAAGHRDAAIRRYENWEQTLTNDLSVAPSTELAALVERVRSGRSIAYTTSPKVLKTRLPSYVRLIGRDEELADLQEHVAEGERLITIVGPAGVGKTSTAVTLGYQLQVETRVPVVYVDLSECRDGLDVLRRLLYELGDEQPTAISIEGVRERLHDRPAILLLDNCEHLLLHAAVVDELHASCPSVTLVLTSRSSLRLHAELVYPLKPLSLPDESSVSHQRLSEPHELLSASAVRLFTERSRRSGVQIQENAHDLRLAARACRAMDGIPLAIELAVARLPMLGLPELVEALDDDDRGWQLSVLGRGSDQRAGARHNSVRDAVAWSYELLSSPAQQLFQRVAVFVGGFDLDAAVSIGATDALDREQTVNALAELVDFHLVARVGDRSGRARFRMLATMRSLAGELLEANASLRTELDARHARHYLEIVGAADIADEVGMARRLRDDVGNIAKTLDWCHTEGRFDAALRFMDQLGPVWRNGGGWTEGADLLDRAIADATPSSLEAVAACELWRTGLLAAHEGHAAAGVREVLARIMPKLGAAQDRDRAARHIAEAVRIATAIGDVSQASMWAEQLRTGARTRQQRWWALQTAPDRIMIAHHAGDNQQALEIIAEAIEKARELGSSVVELRCWMWAGLLDASERVAVDGLPPDLEELLEMAVQTDDAFSQSWLLVSLGAQEVLHGHVNCAAVRFEQVMTIARDMNYRNGLLFAMMGKVGIALADDDLRAAGRVHGVLAARLDDLRKQMPRTFHDAYLDRTKSLEERAKSDSRVADAIEAGRTMSWSDAVEEVHRYLHDWARTVHAVDTSERNRDVLAEAGRVG